jgi:hypothetical protein
MVGVCGLALAVSTTRAAGVTARLWAVGDMARCPNGAPASRAAADVVTTDARPLLALGDLAYVDGSPSEFVNCYNPVWGQFRDQTRPVPGNHEYRTAGAAGYFGYFGPIGNWYAWELNGWQLLALNSNCSSIGGCGVGSAEYTWLEAQLRDNPRPCQLAYWHHARWTQGEHGNTSEVGPLYNLLAQYGVELLLVGHDHTYERYAPLDANGAPSADGVVEIVAGTGGAEHNSVSTINAPAPLVRDDTTYGALSVELSDASWQTEFRPEAGRTFTDTASGACHGGPLSPGTTTTTTGPGSTTTTSTTTTSSIPSGTTTTTTAPGPDTQEPDSTVSAPLAGAGVTSPASFAGTATDDVSVARVRVAVRNDATLQWLQANGSFGSTFTQFDATLTSPGAAATGWSLARALPVAAYHLSVRAVDTSGRAETSTPWVAFQVIGMSTTTTTTTSATTTSTTTTTTTTTAPVNNDFNDRWAFWGYLYSDAKRQSNGTYRWDQAPFRFTASSDRFQRGAALNGIGLRQDSSGAWFTTVAVATIPDPRTAGSAAVRAYLSASIEGEAICGGMVFDNFSLTTVQYIADLYTSVGVPTTIRTYGGGFNEVWVASTYWPVLNTWPFATTARTPGAPSCTVTTK